MSTRDNRRLQFAVSYQKKQREKLAEAAKDLSDKKEHGLVNSLWKARIALTSPTIPSRELREWFRSVSLDSHVVVSHGYIERARDVFCQIVKGLRKDQLVATIQLHAAEQRAAAQRGSQPVVRVYVKHLHDKVGMRLKSYSLDSVFGEQAFASRWGRASKVQNNYVQVFIGRTQLV